MEGQTRGRERSTPDVDSLVEDPGGSRWVSRVFVVVLLVVPFLLLLGGTAVAGEADQALDQATVGSSDGVVPDLDDAVAPVTDAVEPVVDEAAEAVDPVVDPVEDVVDPVVDVLEPVEDVLDPVLDSLGDVLGPVVEVIDPVIEAVDVFPPGTAGPPRVGEPSPPRPVVPDPSVGGKVEAPGGHRLLIADTFGRPRVTHPTTIEGVTALARVTSGSVPSLTSIATPAGPDGAPSSGASAPSAPLVDPGTVAAGALLVLLAALVASPRSLLPTIASSFAPRVVAWKAAALALSVERPG